MCGVHLARCFKLNRTLHKNSPSHTKSCSQTLARTTNRYGSRQRTSRRHRWHSNVFVSFCTRERVPLDCTVFRRESNSDDNASSQATNAICARQLSAYHLRAKFGRVATQACRFLSDLAVVPLHRGGSGIIKILAPRASGCEDSVFGYSKPMLARSASSSL